MTTIDLNLPFKYPVNNKLQLVTIYDTILGIRKRIYCRGVKKIILTTMYNEKITVSLDEFRETLSKTLLKTI